MRCPILAPVLLATLACTGCKAVDPAPQDVDGLLHWFFTGWDTADDAAVAEAVGNLAAAVGAPADPLDGSASALTPDEIAFSGRAVDPSTARGMFMVDTFPCDVDTLQPILDAQHQELLYPGVYDVYERTYTSDVDVFDAGEAPEVTWDVHIEASVVGAHYASEMRGGLRHVPDTPAGDMLVQRTWMRAPASFASNSKEWPQDWQIEVYQPAEGGAMLHAYGVWREMRLGAGLTTDDDGVVRIMLNSMEKWDEQTATLCAGGPPG